MYFFSIIKMTNPADRYHAMTPCVYSEVCHECSIRRIQLNFKLAIICVNYPPQWEAIFPIPVEITKILSDMLCSTQVLMGIERTPLATWVHSRNQVQCKCYSQHSVPLCGIPSNVWAGFQCLYSTSTGHSTFPLDCRFWMHFFNMAKILHNNLHLFSYFCIHGIHMAFSTCSWHPQHPFQKPCFVGGWEECRTM